MTVLSSRPIEKNKSCDLFINKRETKEEWPNK